MSDGVILAAISVCATLLTVSGVDSCRRNAETEARMRGLVDCYVKEDGTCARECLELVAESGSTEHTCAEKLLSTEKKD